MAARPGRTLLASSPIRTQAAAGHTARDGDVAMHAPVPPPRPPSTDRPVSGRPGSSGGGHDAGIADRIAALQEATEITTKRIEMERRKNEELSKKIDISRKKLEESRAKLKGMDDVTEARARVKAVKTGEHRLDVLTSKLNQINKSNEGLRDAIEALRRDKLQRLRIVKRLEREVTETRRKLEQSSTDAAAASEARDKADREIAALQATIQREAAQFEAEFTARIEQFTQQSAARREAEKEEAQPTDASASQAALAKAPIHGALGGVGAEEQVGSMTVEQEIELKHKSIRTLWEIGRREVEVKEQSAKLAQLEDAFAKIQEETGIQTIDEMVNAFVQTEDRNYSVLMMINDLNREIETAEVENATLRAAVEEARSRGNAGQASRDKLYKEWDAQIRTLHKRAQAYDRQYEHASRSLDAIKPGVHSIFQKLGTDSALAEGLAAAGVTDTNIMQHLGLIEQRVSELMHLYEMSASGIPLTLPTEEEEAIAAASSTGASDMGGSRSASPKLGTEVEISRVGGVGAADGNFRMRRAVVAAPIPPSLADLEESSDEEDSGIPGVPRRMSQSARARRISAGHAGPPGASRIGDDGPDADLSEPLDLEQLRTITAALVERKQAKAERRERNAEAARADAAAIGVASPATQLHASVYGGKTPQRASGAASGVSPVPTPTARTPGLVTRPVSRASAVSGGSSPVRTPRRRERGEDASLVEEKKDSGPSAESVAPAGDVTRPPSASVSAHTHDTGAHSVDASIVPHPPAQPASMRPSGRPTGQLGASRRGL